MFIEAIGLLVYGVGAVITYHWMKRLVAEDEKYSSKPAEAALSIVIMMGIWPVAVPMHVIFLIRKKLSGSNSESDDQHR